MLHIFFQQIILRNYKDNILLILIIFVQINGLLLTHTVYSKYHIFDVKFEVYLSQNTKHLYNDLK